MIDVLLAALAGLLFGSFLNVCIYRLPRDLSVVTPRSFCPECDHGIAWYDNIPLLSYVLLRGQCRHCRARISWRYPLVELLTALCFAAAVWIQPQHQIDAMAVKYGVFCAISITLIFADLEERILPDEFTLGGVAAGIIFAWFVPVTNMSLVRFFMNMENPRVVSVIESAAAAAISSGALWLVGFLYEKMRHREGLGLGDVKMVAMIGAFLGLQFVLLTLIVGSLLGAVIGLLYILITRKDASSYELPFGSFLGIGAIAVAFWGEVLMTAYNSFG